MKQAKRKNMMSTNEDCEKTEAIQRLLARTQTLNEAVRSSLSLVTPGAVNTRLLIGQGLRSHVKSVQSRLGLMVGAFLVGAPAVGSVTQPVSRSPGVGE